MLALLLLALLALIAVYCLMHCASRGWSHHEGYDPVSTTYANEGQEEVDNDIYDAEAVRYGLTPWWNFIPHYA